MKRIVFLAGIICVVFFIGCSGGNSPSRAVHKFYDAVQKGDVKALDEVATTETIQLVAMFGDKAKEAVAEMGKITKTTEKIEGNTAVVTVTREDGKTENINLVKTDGKWKVSIDK